MKHEAAKLQSKYTYISHKNTNSFKCASYMYNNGKLLQISKKKIHNRNNSFLGSPKIVL